MPTDPAPDRRARAGFAIIAGLLTVAVLIVNMQAVADLTRDYFDLVVILPDAPGITIGSPVWVEGVESGRVTAVAFLPVADTVEVGVSVRLDGQARALLREDSDARAVRDRFIGVPLVSLQAGSPEAGRLADGDTLRAGPQADPRDLLERARELPASLTSVLEQARRIGAMAEARQPELEALGQRVDVAARTASELSTALEGGSLRPLLGGGLAVQVSMLRERLAEVSEALGAAQDRYVGREDAETELGRSLEGLSTRAARLQADLADLSAALEGGGGTLGRLERDSALTVATRGVQAQMDSVRAEAASIIMQMLLP